MLLVPWDAPPPRWIERDALLVERDPDCAPIERRTGDLHAVDAEPIAVAVGRMGVHVQTWDRDTDTRLESYASPPDVGRAYVLVDDAGGLGVVEATHDSRAPSACYDDCPSFWMRADFVVPPRRSSRGAVTAVGPLPDGLAARLGTERDGGRRARRYSRDDLPPKAAVERDARGWRGATWFDVDGDGRIDLALRVHECGCSRFAIETRARDWDGSAWRVTERYVHLPLPEPPDRCADEP